MRNLVIAPNWIGDAIMAQPLLALLKSDDKSCHIDVLAPSHIVPVFEAMAEVSDVIATLGSIDFVLGEVDR